jgi:Domain of unknown function (DUF4174)
MVMRSYWGIACIVATTQLGEITSMSAGEAALAAYRWENRVLLVFAPDVDSTHYLRQQEMLLNAESGLNERDVVVISVLKDVVSTREEPAAPVSADDLRDAYDVLPHDFRVVLIGKDGGVKLSQDEPILAADLFALIDSMPMRKQEMRRPPG